MSVRYWLAWGATLLCELSTSASPNLTRPVQKVCIGILAKRGLERCREKWSPTAEYLTATVPGFTFEVRPLEHHEVVAAVARGELDFVLANPYLYVEVERLHGATRIATLNNLHGGEALAVYAGVVFCRTDRADIQSLSDVQSKSLMGVAEWSFGGWQMAWRELLLAGIDPRRDLARLEFGGTHDAVVHAVCNGEVDVGTVRADTLPRMALEGVIHPQQLRVLALQSGAPQLPFARSTRVYPEWPFAKTAATSDELAQKVAIALLQMPADAQAARAARCAGWVVAQNYRSVHECLMELHLGPYRQLGEVSLTDIVARYWPWLVAIAAVLLAAVAVSIYIEQLNRRLRQAVAEYQGELEERTRAEQALRKSEQLRAASEKLAALGRLAAGVAHEINNPLTGVLTFAHLLRDRAERDPQDRQDLEVVIRETTRASQIVRNLLDFARERPPTKGPLDINEVVERSVRLIRNQKSFRKIEIVLDLAADLPVVHGDVNQLEQVMLNLAINACEAMPEGGKLSIGTTTANGRIRLQVADTGHGIKPTDLEHIFEPFFSTKPVGKGTGLGLSVSYGIVQEHGGELEVDSQEGRGTTFTVAIPVATTI